MRLDGHILIFALGFSASALSAVTWNVKGLHKRMTIIERDVEVSLSKLSLFCHLAYH